MPEQSDNIDFGTSDFGELDGLDPDSSPAAQKAALSELLIKLKDQSKRERDVFMENVDSEYWCCLCFTTRAQKEEFLRRMGWEEFGDKYLDGVAVAQKQGIPLEAKTPPVRKRNVSQKWKEFTQK